MPLSVNEVGVIVPPLDETTKPRLSGEPAARVALYQTLVTVTMLPCCIKLPFHELVIFWPFGKVNCSVQHLMAVEPVLLSVIFSINPPDH